MLRRKLPTKSYDDRGPVLGIPQIRTSVPQGVEGQISIQVLSHAAAEEARIEGLKPPEPSAF